MTRGTPVSPPRRRFLGRLLGALAGGAWLGSARRAGAAPQGVEQPYVGEIRMFAGDFAPAGWMLCEGQLLPILENETLFQLIGTTYGGDGQDTFALPDLRGRAPIHSGNGFVLADYGGAETVTLVATQIPIHSHAAGASAALGTSDQPAGRVPAVNAAGVPQYGPAADTLLSSSALLSAGGSQAHPNLQPYLGIHFIISLYGVFPTPA
jgi:microcystin-dependent protein